ncbi:TPA: replication initiation factor domain-containing protein [Clostridioides difficile]|nr:replication initiation factor domain-containing protein [Clostridioides difficile]MCK3749053.1 replication initiation factor domain-containing protein [Clostridioides difficile]MCZ1086596.1 replication initiation factor domain-containing protein [Clostridioides difficile]
MSEKYRNGGAECRCKNFENVHGGKLSGKNRNLASTLYIGSKASTKYFCLYEKDKEQKAKGKHTDIKNRFEIRLRSTKVLQSVEELLLTQNPHGLAFYLITDFVDFPDYPLWEIFISHDSLPFEMNPVPVNMERTLQWLEKQVMPSIIMLEELDRLTGTSYMKGIDEHTKLSEKQEMTVLQICTDISEVIESEGVFYE